jgi:hypothetical protein
MKHWLFCLLLSATTLLLSSCIGIESDIRIRQDGSGVLTLSYTISQFIKNIDAGRSEKQLPLPVNEEEFRRSAEQIEGLRLTDLEQREDEENIYIRAEMEFDSVEAVNALGRDGQLGISLETQGGTTTFRQLIYQGQQGEEITEESLEMIETFFKGYELVYSVTVPSEVTDHSLGVLAPNGRTVTYSATVPEILKEPEPLVLEVIW